MANENPQIVLDAATGQHQSTIGLPVDLNPVTISRYAWLEKIGSPFLTRGTEFKVSTVVPTIWVLAASKQELKEASKISVDDLKERSLEWADEHIDVGQLPSLIEAVTDMLLDVGKASPRSGEQGKN